jgi:hypothetical protein
MALRVFLDLFSEGLIARPPQPSINRATSMTYTRFPNVRVKKTMIGRVTITMGVREARFVCVPSFSVSFAVLFVFRPTAACQSVSVLPLNFFILLLL